MNRKLWTVATILLLSTICPVALATDSVLVDYTVIEDGTIFESLPNHNLGINSNLYVRPGAGTARRAYLWPTNLHDAIGADKLITSVLCSLWVNGITDDGWLYVFGMLKTNVIEGATNYGDPDSVSGGGGCTWNDADADPTEWGMAGCAATGTEYNTGDGTGADRRATPMDSVVNVDWSAQWVSFNIDTLDANAWYNGDSTGVILISKGAGEADFIISSTENTTEANRPRMWVYYEDAGGYPHVPTSYYVNADGGSNSNDGSIGSPWDSLHYALTNGIVEPGDTIWMRGATYSEQINLVSEGTVNNGTPDSLIYIKAYPGETVILNGGIGVDNNTDKGENYHFEGFRISGSSGHGFRCGNTNGDATSIYEFKDMTISANAGCGAYFGYQAAQYDCVYFYGCNIDSNVTPNEEGNSGITFDCYGNIYVDACSIRCNGDPDELSSENKGINMRNQSPISGYLKNSYIANNIETGAQWNAQNTIVEYNVFIGNGILDIEEIDKGDNNLSLGPAATGNIVRFNKVVDTGRYGIECYGEVNLFYNNTIVDRKPWAGGNPAEALYRGQFSFFSADTGNIILNNIICNFVDYDTSFNTSCYVCDLLQSNGTNSYADNDWDYNCYFTESHPDNYVIEIKSGSTPSIGTLAVMSAAYGEDANSIQQYPAFEDTSGTDPDLTLQAISPCIDAGQDTICFEHPTFGTIILTDFSGDAPDMGYWEYTGEPPESSSVIIIIGD